MESPTGSGQFSYESLNFTPTTVDEEDEKLQRLVASEEQIPTTVPESKLSSRAVEVKEIDSNAPCTDHGSPNYSKCKCLHKCVHRETLFPTVADSDTHAAKKPFDATFLITGFGLRNIKSLEDALLDVENKRVREYFYRMQYLNCDKFKTGEEEASGDTSLKFTTPSQTDGSASALSENTKKLKYLMGISTDAAEEGADIVPRLEEIVYEDFQAEEPVTGTTIAMRHAQKYLRNHKIFQFFQFLIAHILSDLPDSPIEFLIDLLDKCLIYRSGYGDPPLLYQKPHIEQLFYLMDPMKTGFIELKQYITGMVTLGICSYNQNPPLSKHGLVAKNVFIEEAYENLTNMLNDMIRRRWVGKAAPLPPQPTMPPPPTPQLMYSNMDIDIGGGAMYSNLNMDIGGG